MFKIRENVSKALSAIATDMFLRIKKIYFMPGTPASGKFSIRFIILIFSALAVFAIILIFVSIGRMEAANAVQNSSFESGTVSWAFYAGGGGTFISSAPGYAGTNAAKVSLTSSNSNIQLYQTGIFLEPNTHYRLTFAAYSSSGRDLDVKLQRHSSPYTNYGLNYNADLGTSWQTFTADFTTSSFSGSTTDSRLMFWLAPYVQAGDIYYIDDVRLEKADGALLSITTHPASQTIAIGQTATFTVSASGTAPFFYQWQKNNANIAGATLSAYTTPAVTAADNGARFRVVVTNIDGSAISNEAVLVMNTINESVVFSPYSSSDGYLEVPSAGVRLTTSIVGDVDGDSKDDFVVAQRLVSPAIVWYKKESGNTWKKYIVESEAMDLDVGSALYDIDKDGDLDVILFGNPVPPETGGLAWWWENPGISNNAVYSETSWTKHLIKNTGYTGQHDAKFGDFDGDGKDELAWIGRGSGKTKVYVAEIPADPKTLWITDAASNEIYTFNKITEGMEVADIDLDGKADIITGGGWLKYSGTVYTFNLIGAVTDRSVYEARIAVGQIVPGGRPEVVFGAGDFTGTVAWYEWIDVNSNWTRHGLDGASVHGHSVAMGDLDSDGDPDIFVAEMTNWGTNTNPNSKMRIYKNNGDKTFTITSFQNGINNHESKLGDFNGDGRLDILSKSYADANPPAPKLIVWLQTKWQYKLIDNSRAKYGGGYKWFGLAFVDANNDGYKDIVSGKYYYKNPGGDMLNNGNLWPRAEFPVNVDASLATDVDGDANADVIGFGYTSAYTPSESNPNGPGVYWMEKTGPGDLTADWTARLVVPNDAVIKPTPHSQSQGFRTAQIVPGGKEEIVSAANNPGQLFYIQIPTDPDAVPWPVTVISTSHNNQGVAVGDIDNDGDIDVAGVKVNNREVMWWENPGVPGQADWAPHYVGNTTAIVPTTGSDGPDRVEIADLNGDGRLDIILTDEVWSGTATQQLRAKSKTYWFTQPASVVTAPNWGLSKAIVEQQSTNSLDVADMDNDGDIDVVTGEHKGDKELTIWKNNGIGKFSGDVISKNYENHLGGRLADLDGDGDLDAVSITWTDNYATTGGLMHMWRNDSIISENGNILPSISIDSPLNGQQFESLPEIVITAFASDIDGTIEKVDFYEGSTILGTDTSSPYSYLWSDVADGAYALTAEATDNLGGIKTSIPVNINVGPKILYLTSITVTPANASIWEGSNQQFIATPKDQFGDPMAGVSVLWESSNPGVAAIDSSSGEVTGVAEGTAVITAINSAISGTAVANIISPFPNLIQNYGFESGAVSWTFYSNNAATFSISSPGYAGSGAAKLSIKLSGTNIQLFQSKISLEPDTKYRLSFNAYSSTGSDIEIKILKHLSPYTLYGLDYTANLGTSWQNFAVEFISSGFTKTVSDGRLMFWASPYAKAGDVYYIDDVRLEKLGI